jgi:hypothetical protein
MRVPSKQLIFLFALLFTLFLLFGPLAPELGDGGSTSAPSASTPAADALESVPENSGRVSDSDADEVQR